MAVYTKVSSAEITQHLKDYNLGELVAMHEIIDGIDNSNFILETQKGKFILTIFESRINKNDLPFFVNFKLHLSQKGIYCPAPILDNQGLAITEIKNKKSLIVTFLNGTSLKPRQDGYYETITPQHCFEVGKISAQLHVAAQDFKVARDNDLGAAHFAKLFNKFAHLLDDYQKDLRAEIEQNIAFINKNWRVDLPSCVAHLDLFPDNVFFDQFGKASGVIDFYFSARELMIYDLAIAVNAWCFDHENNFSEEKFREMIRGYESIRQLSAAEKDFLAIALFAAAMRFLLTRLHDMFFTAKDSFVKIKNPQEYLAKSRFFRAKL